MSENNEGTTITWNALTKKRAEMVLEMEEHQKRAAELRVQILHMDAVLRLLRPDFAAEGLPVRHRRRTKSPYFEHGELTERIYDALREHGTTTSGDIATKAMLDNELDPINDKPTRTDFVRRFSLQLKELARVGQVQKVDGRGVASLWRFAASPQTAALVAVETPRLKP